ncbi:Hemocyte protein-glutamine gamma-glutamyltransfer ase [Trichuris trichiura]|uniref:Hemocyte protein-glutamine gamma-glutamyltransfer ase n=1 Tax=Trichuris trichiura TaxID=36087 RepID=A0A077Z110_TRITR|nr:Hemocyte protein-glutamine gamma-glutamyltransfer ase [Trichuris trichiura]
MLSTADGETSCPENSAVVAEYCAFLVLEKRTLVMESLFPGYADTISRLLANNPKSDVDFEFLLDENFVLGDDASLAIIMKNNAKEERDVRYAFEDLRIRQTRKFSSVLSLNDYLSRSGDTFTFTIMVRATVQQTEQVFVESRDMVASAPNITIHVLEPLMVGKSSEIEFNFSNPLPVTLTGCKFIIEGPGVVETVDVPCKKIPPRAYAKARHTVKPYREGTQRVIIARFSCDQLKDIHGAVGVAVGN